jgi:hypothetical protein
MSMLFVLEIKSAYRCKPARTRALEGGETWCSAAFGVYIEGVDG